MLAEGWLIWELALFCRGSRSSQGSSHIFWIEKRRLKWSCIVRTLEGAEVGGGVADVEGYQSNLCGHGGCWCEGMVVVVGDVKGEGLPER